MTVGSCGKLLSRKFSESAGIHGAVCTCCLDEALYGTRARTPPQNLASHSITLADLIFSKKVVITLLCGVHQYIQQPPKIILDIGYTFILIFIPSPYSDNPRL